MTPETFEKIVLRACLAPSVHNIQPVRWRLTGYAIELLCDGTVALPASDPGRKDVGLSCGAAVEATVLALSTEGRAAEVETFWPEEAAGRAGLFRVARIASTPGGSPLPLASQLEQRATFRGPFAGHSPSLFGWSPESAVLVTDRTRIERIAVANDVASLRQMRVPGVRAELRHWMRLGQRHPRYGHDGLNRDAMRMSAVEARAAGLVLGPLWGLLDRLGLAAGLTAEDAATRTAPVIAGFHRPETEDPLTSGRFYLRLWLAATSLGFAGWPMAALTDDAETHDDMRALLHVPTGRRLIQMIRFGVPTDEIAPRARRPLSELVV